VAIDFLQRIHHDTKGRQSRADELGDIVNEIARTARECKVPILLLSQFSREANKQERVPKLSDLRDSGTIEQAADVAILLHRPNKDDWEIEMWQEKNRAGEKGVVKVMFHPLTMTFEGTPHIADFDEFNAGGVFDPEEQRRRFQDEEGPNLGF
jgi:replicative DNA helicase